MNPAFLEHFLDLGISFFQDKHGVFWFTLLNVSEALDVDPTVVENFLIGNPGINTPFFRRKEYHEWFMSEYALLILARQQELFVFLKWYIPIVEERLAQRELRVPKDQQIDFARTAHISAVDLFPPDQGE